MWFQVELQYTCDRCAKLEVGERYIQFLAPDNGRVPFPSIITI